MSIIDSSQLGSPFNSGNRLDLGRGSEQQVGSVGGQAAVLIDGEFSLADAAEEITLHMADRTEEKHHTERRFRSEAPLTVIPSEAILAYMAQTHDGDAQAKLVELAGNLLKGRAEPSRLVGQHFGDAPRQYLALQFALRQGESEMAPAEILAGISDALAELELRSGSEIRAGLNTIEAAGRFASDITGVLGFQSTYRDVVLGENTLAKTLSRALEQFGGRNCADGLKSLIQALGLDLAATNPSINSTRLEALVKDMYLLTVAVTVLEGCNELCLKVGTSSFDIESVREERLMLDVVDISGGQWVIESQFSALATDHGALAVKARIDFLGGVRAILKDLPLPLYVDSQMRQAILDAAQAAADAAIAEENA